MTRVTTLSILGGLEGTFSFPSKLTCVKFTSFNDFLLSFKDSEEVEDEMGIFRGKFVEFLNFLELAMLLRFEEESESCDFGFNFKGRNGKEIRFADFDFGGVL